tara:strand:- start:10369 stop:10767 length:399 start_codon:yes stop_codon:yes gene_type:complete
MTRMVLTLNTYLRVFVKFGLVSPTISLITVDVLFEGCAGNPSRLELKEMPKTNEKTMPENQDETSTLLVGYVRKSNAGGAVKISINTDAFSDCSTYVTSDGQSYVPLVISVNALNKVLNGERAVTTVSQLLD